MIGSIRATPVSERHGMRQKAWAPLTRVRAAAAVLLIVMGDGGFLGGGSLDQGQWVAGWLIWMRRVSLAGCERCRRNVRWRCRESKLVLVVNERNDVKLSIGHEARSIE